MKKVLVYGCMFVSLVLAILFAVWVADLARTSGYFSNKQPEKGPYGLPKGQKLPVERQAVIKDRVTEFNDLMQHLENPDAKAALDFLDKHLFKTNTSYGMVVDVKATNKPEYKDYVTYKTEDGNWWKVPYFFDGKEYKYGTPEKIGAL